VAGDAPDVEDEAVLVPARMLCEYAYCARLGVLMWAHGEFAESADTVDGTRRHKRVDRPGPELPGAEPEAAPDELDFSGGARDEAPPFRTRAVWLSAASERLTCKIDVVQLEDGLAIPVDTKRGMAPDVPEGAWEPERVQLCAQALILRASGYRCESGYLYFAGSKRRVEVVFDEGLVARTRALVAELAEAAVRDELPAPLVDSPKCARCSLVGICLPDETRLLAESQPELPLGAVRQVLVPDTARVPLYVTKQGARIGVAHGELVVSEREMELGRVRIAETSHVAVFGHVHVSAGAMMALMREEIPICYFSYGGWFNGIARGTTHKHALMRRAQFRVADDDLRSLAIARAIVRSKIRNQRTLLRRNADGVDELTMREMARLADVALKAETAAVLLGIEGAAAKLYFGSFAKMLRRRELGFDFAVRTRRPPRDPVNAMLSFAYALLAKDALVVLEAVGLDPFVGFYHQPRYGKPALALDLMEELRPIVADSVVLTAVNNGEVSPTSFVRRADGCALTSHGRKAFLATYERRLDQVVQHPLFGYKATWRRVMEVQARLLGRHLQGELPRYTPIETR